MGRRDEVWERKRQQFLARRAGQGGSRAAQNGGHCGRPPPLQSAVSQDAVPPAPGSPLSELMHRGYPEMAIPEPTVSLPPKQPNYVGRPMQQGGGGIVGGGASRSQSRSRPSSNQEGFDRGVAQQWSSNVKASVEEHQQQNDPNFAGFKKPSGYRVSQPAGGGSSISLSWGGQESAGAFEPTPSRQGRNNSRGPSPMAAAAAQRVPSQGSRANGGMMGCLNHGGHAAPPTGSVVGSRRSSPPFGTDSGAPLPRAPVREPSPVASHLGFGGRVEGSSNAYACGHNQNAGNYISDRRMTKVARPPGGCSSVVFG